MINSAGMGGALEEITGRIPRDITTKYEAVQPHGVINYAALPPAQTTTSPLDSSQVEITAVDLQLFPDLRGVSDGQFSYFPEVSGIDETSLGVAAMKSITQAAERQIQDARAKLQSMHRYLQDPSNCPKPRPESPETIVAIFNLATLDDDSVMSHIPPK